MSIFAMILIGAIAAFHLYVAWFEMFAWTTRGARVFARFPREMFEPTKPLAANLGLYNSFLAIGLLWSLVISDPVWQTNVASVFLAFITVAGIFGAATAARQIFYVQAMPALVALALLYLG